MSSAPRPDPGVDPEITALLHAWREGRPGAAERLMPAVYLELRRIARRQLQGERATHTLQPTALVHEAYLRLAGQRVEWRDRSHFFALAATLMRRILVDHARGRLAAKRAADTVTLTLSAAVESRPIDVAVLDLDRALERLAAAHPRPARIVELRFFSGLEIEEIAEALDLSGRTVQREWVFARAWLLRALAGQEPT